MNAAAVLGVFAMMALPGIGAGLAIWPAGTVSIPTRVGVSIALGYGVAGVISILFAASHTLTAPGFSAALLVATLVLWFVGLRRSSLREHASAIAREAREDPWSVGIGVLILLGIAIIRFSFTSHVFVAPSSFRYWADAMEVRDAHGIPATSLQYGFIYPPTTSKAVLNALNATLSFITGRDPIRSLPPVLWLASVGLAGALWALGRELGLRLTAPLVPVVLVMNELFLNDEMTRDMTSYRAEIVGRMIAFAGLALALRALRREAAREEIVAAGLLFAVGAGTHLVPLLIAVVIFALYAAALALRTWHGRTVLKAAGVLAIAGAAGLVVLIAPRGDIGLGGSFQRGQYADFRRANHFDPTAYLLKGRRPQVENPLSEGTWYYPPGYLFRELTSQAVRISVGSPRNREESTVSRLSQPICLMIWIGALALAVAIFLWFPRALRPLGPAAWGLAVVLFLVSLFFSLRYDVLIFARFGLRRVIDYSSVPFVILGFAMLEAGLQLLRRISRTAMRAASAVAVVAFAAVVLPSARPQRLDAIRGNSAVAVLHWVRTNVPCTDRVLTNIRTSGVFQAATGRVDLLEGMAPYLRPGMLNNVVALIQSTKEFFQRPLSHSRFLQENGVDVIMVVNEDVPLGFLGQPLGASVNRFDRTPFLHEIHRSKDLTVFRVVGVDPTRTFPSASGRPGYRCFTDGRAPPAA